MDETGLPQTPLTLAKIDFPYYRSTILITVLAVINVVVWSVAGSLYSVYVPAQVPILVLAYTLGLRHAFDGDHIAAIDNVTRQFVVRNSYPVTVGFFFSIGHSTIVILATILLAALSSWIKSKFEAYHSTGNLLGSSVSASFLFIVGCINAISIYNIAVALRKKKAGDLDGSSWQDMMSSGGIFTRIFGSWLFRAIDQPWKMYCVGFLFGLGFDTSTEITLLGLTVIQAGSGTRGWFVIFLAFLFTAGMTILDSIDGIVMLGVYGWAAVSPYDKLYYNLVITTVSCLFAFVISLLQVLGILQTQYSYEGPFWEGIGTAMENSLVIGLALLVSLIVGWLFSKLLFRYYHTPSDDCTPTVITSPDHTNPDLHPNGSLPPEIIRL